MPGTVRRHHHALRLRHPLPASVTVLRALQLGDLLCAVPALRMLRRALPAANITLIGLPWAASFVRRFSHLIDAFIEFPGFPGLPERAPQLEAFPAFLERVQEKHFDLALQLHGSGSVVNPLLALFGARYAAGYYRPGDFCPDPVLFIPYPDHGSEIERAMLLMDYLGYPRQSSHLEFPLTDEDTARFDSLDAARRLSGRSYAVLHPGARYPSRRWDAAKFAAVGDLLAVRGLGVVITGTEEEAPLAHDVQRRMRSPSVNLAGKTGLGELGALLRRARLLVSNDTGITHIADALGVPRVVVIAGSDVHRWQPPRRAALRTVSVPVPCRPCGFLKCPVGFPCSKNVTVEQVVAKADELLGENVYAA